MANKKIVVLPCAGNGSRFGSELPKQYMLIGHKTVLEHTLDVFFHLSEIDKIVVITSSDDLHIDKIQLKYSTSKLNVLKVGGPTRADSVRNGLNALDYANEDWVLVHDVARCCITSRAVINLISKLENDPVGGILAIGATDTIKQSRCGQIIDKTLDRNTIYQAQTPQMFRLGILKNALNSVNLDMVTDEASSIEQINLPVQIIDGESTNIKITYQLDLKIAEVILDSKQ